MSHPTDKIPETCSGIILYQAVHGELPAAATREAASRVRQAEGPR